MLNYGKFLYHILGSQIESETVFSAGSSCVNSEHSSWKDIKTQQLLFLRSLSKYV